MSGSASATTSTFLCDSRANVSLGAGVKSSDEFPFWGDRVRLLAVYDVNAPQYARRRNDYSALAEKDLTVDSAGVFKNERSMAEDLASSWWSSGLRPAG